MNNIDIASILIGIVVITFIICEIKDIFTTISNCYIKRQRKRLFDNSSLAQQSRDLGLQLSLQMSSYVAVIDTMGLNRTYNCASSIVANASNNTVKYLIKYSNLENDIYYLEQLDFCISFMQRLNVFKENMKEIYRQSKSQLPTLVYMFATPNKVPFIICDLDMKIAEVKNPVFCFSYVSPAGNSRRDYEVEISCDVMRNIQLEISDKLNKKGYCKIQRGAMTNDLREAIKKRDNYTCCLCGNSIFDEPNLLLEVDHITPISKGGKTIANNLQTLCWRCNRAKSNK